MFYKLPQNKHILTQHGRATQAALPRQFTVCVWNWQKSKQKGWAEEFTQLAQNAHLFLAQEVRRAPLVEAAMENTPYCWNEAISFFSLKGQHPIGVATGCVAPPKQVTFKQGEREPILHIPKMALAALIPMETGIELLAVNLHAVNFTGTKSFETHLLHAAELLLDFNGPLILGGDFNAWNLKRSRLLQRMTHAAGLQEVIFKPDTRTRCFGRPVDYLFVRGLKTLAAGSRPTSASDHNPLLACLELC